ncbi:signal peptide peptidase SppA [Acidobacteria bacterium AH-259-D05]|nr:signal peptide peptidase SppA [Acidobacteria bacterium AH-259-D05]
MSRIGTWILAILIVGLISVAIAFGVAYYLISGRAIRIQEDTVVEIHLTGFLNELPRDNILAQIVGLGTPSLWELGKIFQYAAKDDRVSGVYLEIHPLLLSWAQIEELRDYMKRFRDSGKPIHAFLAVDMVRDPELYLASAADSITLNPDAGLLVNGLLAEVTFYKKTMDKLGIRPEFIQFKEYKSAESFTRETMTREIREMYESILEDIQERFISAVAQDRSLDEETIRRVLEAGVSPATQALGENLVDALGYENEVQNKFIEGGSKKYRNLAANRYLGLAEKEYRTRSEHKVALIGGLGTITSGNSDPFSETMGGMTVASNLRKIRENEDIKGVIFRVDSPGGSAVGSDMVWKEVALLEEANKPVVVAMSGVAGSGGYYISMAARHIVSQPSTITGSIGVIFGKFDLKGLYQWLGITVDQVKTSPNADILSSSSSLNDEQRRSVESWMETIYRNFVQKAADGRKVEYEILEPRARGRIYTGVQAKEIGLVDQLGGLQTAIDHMKEALELAEDEDIELVLYPRPKSLWETLTSGGLLKIGRRPSLSQWLQEQFPVLSRPGPWLLMPEAKIY